MKTLPKLAAVAISAFALVGASRAATITYDDFTSVAGLQLNGNASQVGSHLRLTPATTGQSGSAFSTSSIGLDNLSSFSTRFQFEITSSGGIGDGDGAGADGIVFTVQTVSNTAGGAGGGIGYSGIPNSVGIEFDTYNNGGQDAGSGNHVGIDLNGSVSSVTLTSITPRFNDGNVWTAWVDYNGNTQALEVRVNQTGIRPVAATLSYTVDLSAVLGSPNAFVGFTAGTGAGYGNQDVLNWNFTSDYNPIGNVPDAGSTLLLLAFGCAGLGLGARRFAWRLA